MSMKLFAKMQRLPIPKMRSFTNRQQIVDFVDELRIDTWHVVYKYSLLKHCIKIKSPAIFLLNEQYVFVGGNISFLCVLSCSSEEA